MNETVTLVFKGGAVLRLSLGAHAAKRLLNPELTRNTEPIPIADGWIDPGSLAAVIATEHETG